MTFLGKRSKALEIHAFSHFPDLDFWLPQFLGNQSTTQSLFLVEFLEEFRINKKLRAFKTCQKHKMNFSLTESKIFFVSHNACVNISQTQYYLFDGIPEMLVFKFMHFLKTMRKPLHQVMFRVSKTLGIHAFFERNPRNACF